jgi:hypothetical protein
MISAFVWGNSMQCVFIKSQVAYLGGLAFLLEEKGGKNNEV